MIGDIRMYRFNTRPHWRQCLSHGFDVEAGALSPSARLSTDARRLGTAAAVDAVVAGRERPPMWRRIADGRSYLVTLNELDGREIAVEVDPALASATRWVADRHWLWVCTFRDTTVRRYDVRTLEPDLSRDLRMPVIDIASDGHEGLWILASIDHGAFVLRRLDCDGRPIAQRPLPVAACAPSQIGSVERGATLLVLAAGGRRIVVVDPAKDQPRRVVAMDSLAEHLIVHRLSTDANQRVALWGRATLPKGAVLFVLDANADSVDGPIVPRFDGRSTDAPAVDDVAVSSSAVWLAAATGLWTLTADAAGAAAADGTLLTPRLLSPESYTERGWLRAELDADLPRGAVIEASFASTNDDAVARDLDAIARDDSAAIEHRQQLIWSRLEHPARRTFRIAGPGTAGVPIAVPLFDARDRWLWLRLRLLAPPGTKRPTLRELRVLYPDASIDRYLPATFKGRANDPDGVLRRLVGVLESTTQGLDARIARIGAYLQAATAPDEWLDYMARWLDLPWDDALPERSKRALLRNAGALVEQRGTRRGLQLLLASLLGDGGTAQVADVTVDHPVLPVGGAGRRGAALPLVLAGASTRIATLNLKAVIGRTRIRCAPSDVDPLRAIVPTVTVRIVADVATRSALEGLVPGILTQYVPAGVALRVRWQRDAGGVLFADGERLDGDGPGRLGETSTIGRTVLSGRSTSRLTETGVDADLRLT